MSVHVSSRVWQYSQSTGPTRLVLLSLADQANDDGMSWPTIDNIAERCMVSRRSVFNYLNELKELGELTWVTRHEQMRSNVYTITVSAPPAESAPPLAHGDRSPVQDLHPPSADGGTTPVQDMHHPRAASYTHPVQPAAHRTVIETPKDSTPPTPPSNGNPLKTAGFTDLKELHSYLAASGQTDVHSPLRWLRWRLEKDGEEVVRTEVASWRDGSWPPRKINPNAWGDEEW